MCSWMNGNHAIWERCSFHEIAWYQNFSRTRERRDCTYLWLKKCNSFHKIVFWVRRWLQKVLNVLRIVNAHFLCNIYNPPVACLFGHWQQLQTHEMQYHRKVLNNLEVCREILFRLKKEYRFGFQIGLGKFLVLICKMKRKISHVTW